LRGRFSDAERNPYPIAWQWGADAWIVLALAVCGVAVAFANRRLAEQRYDRAQLAIGVLIVAVALFNVVMIVGHAAEHTVASNAGDSSQDTIGVGLWLTFAGGLLTALGALLGNTPAFLFAAPDRAVEIAEKRGESGQREQAPPGA
jgi:hypothetical protein